MEPETDIQLVGRIYRDTIAATKRDNPAYHAALAAWRERHPEAEDRPAKERVAIRQAKKRLGQYCPHRFSPHCGCPLAQAPAEGEGVH